MGFGTDENKIFTKVTTALAQGTEGSEEFVAQVAGWSDRLDASRGGLLLVAITLMILLEMAKSLEEERAPRVLWMFWRIVGAGALLWGYSHIVGLLTGLIGSTTDWPEISTLTNPLQKGFDHRMAKDLGLHNVYYFVVWLFMFIIDCLCALFAILAITILSKMQALLLVILVATGKTCIIISIIPGVGIGKSWAKAVATVAAWGMLSGIVYGAVGMTGVTWNKIGGSTLGAHIPVWIAYSLMGIFTLSIPSIAGMISSGAASRAPGVAAAMGGALLGAKLLMPKMPSVKEGLGGRPFSKKKGNGGRSDEDLEKQGWTRPGKVGRGDGNSGAGNSSAGKKRSSGGPSKEEVVGRPQKMPSSGHETTTSGLVKGQEWSEGPGADELRAFLSPDKAPSRSGSDRLLKAQNRSSSGSDGGQRPGKQSAAQHSSGLPRGSNKGGGAGPPKKEGARGKQGQSDMQPLKSESQSPSNRTEPKPDEGAYRQNSAFAAEERNMAEAYESSRGKPDDPWADSRTEPNAATAAKQQKPSTATVGNQGNAGKGGTDRSGPDKKKPSGTSDSPKPRARRGGKQDRK